MNNNNFNYQQPNLYSNGNISPNQTAAPTINNEYIPDEQSYIENILRVNKGKKVKIEYLVGLLSNLVEII